MASIYAGPALYPEFSSPEAELSYPSGPSLYNPIFWLLCSPLFPHFSPLPFLLGWHRVMSTLDSPRCPFFRLCSPCIHSKLSLPPYLGAVTSLNFSFLSFFHSVIESFGLGFCMLTQNNKRSTVTHDVQSHLSFHFEPLGQIGIEHGCY